MACHACGLAVCVCVVDWLQYEREKSKGAYCSYVTETVMIQLIFLVLFTAHTHTHTHPPNTPNFTSSTPYHSLQLHCILQMDFTAYFTWPSLHTSLAFTAYFTGLHCILHSPS